MHHGGDEDGWLCWCSYSIIPTRLTPSIKGREPRAAGKWQQGQITRAKPWRCETPPGMKKATGSCGVALAGRTRAPCSPLCQHSMSLPAVGPLPSPCPGWTCYQWLPQRLERGLGCSSRQVLRVLQRAPAWRSCTGLKLSRGLKPSPRPLHCKGAGIWGQSGQRWAKQPGGKVLSPPHPMGASPEPREEPSSTLAEPTVHSTGCIMQR